MSSARATNAGVEDRRPLSARLTPTAYEALEDFCHAHRVSIVAVLEAAGRVIAGERELLLGPTEDLPQWIRVTVEEARAITEERRSRRRS